MKKSNKKFPLVAVLLVSLGMMLTVLPAQLPAQDIDDVIEGLDQDFSLGGKQEVKQNNVADANEQNREDIKIEENEAANAGPGTVTGNLTVTFSAMAPPNNFTFVSVIADGTSAPVGAPVIISGPPISVPISNITVPAGVSFTFGINLTCNSSPNCDATLSLSGVINCTLMTGSMVLGENKTISTTCSTLTAP